MGFDFKKVFNKQAQIATSLNRGINKAIGKDIFQDVKPIEEPKEFPPYDSYPKFDAPEPGEWNSENGESREFGLVGSTIYVSKELDTCLRYRPMFRQAAEYYTEQFRFRFDSCAKDFDSFTHYFRDMYLEGLVPMIRRACCLLLPFGVFTADENDFLSVHVDRYNRAIVSYEIISGTEEKKNRAAAEMGNQVGNAIQMRGGGFGFKGAMKGVAQAEAFNLGMNLFGKFVAHQSTMSQEEKAKVFAALDRDLFFEEVNSDYYNTFLTFVQLLINSGVLKGIKTSVSENEEKLFNNLANPMFPQDRVPQALAQLISSNPFVPKYFELLEQKLGRTDETERIIKYFTEV